MTIDPSHLAAFTEVRESLAPGAGLGLFATRCIPAGTVWWKATPENVVCLSRTAHETLARSHLASSPVSGEFLNAIRVFGYIDDDTNEIVVAIDDSRFVNHSDTPNLISYPEDPNNQAMAVRGIEPGEEITEDYRTYRMNTWDLPEVSYLLPDILVLDEAASALDLATEAAITRTLERLGQGRTVIAVSHRLATVARFDRICVLEAGRLAEAGSHAELLAAGGAYARLWQRHADVPAARA